MENLITDLTKFYNSNNLLDVNLRENCKKTKKCWGRLKENRHSNYQLYHPYLGDKYAQERIMIIGINMNDCGHRGAASRLANAALEQITDNKKGKKRTFSNNSGYRGSLLWQRLLSFAAILLQTKGVISKKSNKKYPTKEDLSNAFPYIAFTNSIKCSPKEKNSKPSTGMWKNCPFFILKKEIDILKPRYLIAFGSDNKYYLKSLLKLDNYINKDDSKISIFEYKNDDGENVKVICMPHPSSPIGSAYARMDELINISSAHLK